MAARILVVEDERVTREAVSRGLARRLDDVEIASAGDVEEGLALIQASRPKSLFDIGIFDFKLPRRQGTATEVDESLCHTLSTVNPDALVIHITAYADDRDILRHVQAHHQGSGAALGLISKLDPDWARRVLTLVRQHLAGQEVAQAFEAVFPGGAETRAPQRTPGQLGSATHRLGTLFRAVQRHWPNLDARRRSLVLSRLVVSERDGVVRDIRLRELAGEPYEPSAAERER